MPELKKVWVVRDASLLDFTTSKGFDPAALAKDDAIEQFMWEMDIDEFINVIRGSIGKTWWEEHSKIYPDEGSASADAKKRLEKVRKQAQVKTASTDPLADRVAARWLRANGKSQVFHKPEEIAKAYPYGGSTSTLIRWAERLFKKWPDMEIEVANVAPERWIATIHGKGWSETGGQTTSETDAIRRALKEAVAKKH